MAILAPYGFTETHSDDWVITISSVFLSLNLIKTLIMTIIQDLLWTMVPQWDHFHTASTRGLPRPWQIHNHCLALTNKRGISGGKVSQWQLYKCMRDKYGPMEFSYMPESLVIPA